MREAIAVARSGWGTTHPNPVVGAVIVEQGRVVARGFHQRAGEPHAEVLALRNLGRSPNPGATLYVTLEPCSSHGRTPPCCDAIIAAGISRVVMGAMDEDVRHGGRAVGLLQQAGLEVLAGVLEAECRDLNLIFHHCAAGGGPLIAWKTASTLDGYTATRQGQSQWITGVEARADVMRWRRYFPAIGVGAGTALADNPSLTARINGETWCPRRIVFDRRGILSGSQELKLFTDAWAGQTTVLTAVECQGDLRKSLPATVRVEALPNGGDDLRSWLQAEGLSGLLVEGGNRLAGELLRAGCIDYLFAYRAPLLLGEKGALPMAIFREQARLEDGLRLRQVRHESFGEDQLMRGFLIG